MRGSNRWCSLQGPSSPRDTEQDYINNDNDDDNDDDDDDDTDLDQVGDELGQVGDHAWHAALGDGAQSQDPRLLDLPLRMEQSFLEC